MPLYLLINIKNLFGLKPVVNSLINNHGLKTVVIEI